MKKVFYLTDSHIKLVDLSDLLTGNHEKEIEVSWDDKDSLEELLQTVNDKENFAVVLDFIDEAVEHSWLPKLMPWEKPSYERQIKERFHADNGLFIKINWLNEYRKSLDGASEQSMLVTSVLGNEHLNEFFDLIEEAQLPISAIYSYAFLLEKYFLSKLYGSFSISKKKLMNPFLLVVQETRHRYRQLFFNNGRLRVSRVIELDHELETDIVLTVGLAHESFSIIKYLYNTKVMPFNTPVGLIYIGEDDTQQTTIIERFKETTTYSDDITNTYLASNLYELTRTDKAKSPLYGMTGFLFKFLRDKTPATFYSNDFLEKITFFKQLKASMLVIFYMIMIFGSVYLVKLAVENALFQEKVEVMDARLAQYQEEKNDLQKEFSLEYDAEDIKAAVFFSESILNVQARHELGGSFVTISKVLSEHSHIIISKIDWKKVNKFDGKTIEINLDGWVFPFDKSFKNPVKWVDMLVTDFLKQPEITKVVLTREPLDRRLKKALAISAGEIEHVNALPFSIKLTVGSNDVESK